MNFSASSKVLESNMRENQCRASKQAWDRGSGSGISVFGLGLGLRLWKSSFDKGSRARKFGKVKIFNSGLRLGNFRFWLPARAL